MWKPLPSIHVLRKYSKRIIFANGGLELLQMVSGVDTGRCVSEEAVPQRGRHESVCSVPIRTVGPKVLKLNGNTK